MASVVTHPLQALASIFYRPTDTLLAVKQARGWSWLPGVLWLSLLMAAQWLYFNKVDFTWYQSTYLAPELTEMARADREQVMAMLSQQRFITMGMLTALVSVLLLHVLMGFYLSRMTLSDENNLLGFTDWFALTWWASMPGVLVVLASLGLLITQQGEISQGILSLAAINRVLGLTPEHHWYGWFESLSWLLPWQIALYAIGIRNWTALTLKQGLGIAALPFLMIYGGWAAFNVVVN